MLTLIPWCSGVDRARSSARCSRGCWRVRAGARRVAEARGAQAAQAGRGGGAPRRRRGARRATSSDRLRAREQEIERLQARASDLAAEKARLEGDLAAAVDRNALLKTAEETLRDAFRALASEALQQNSESMLRLARATLGEMQTRAVADLDKRQQSIAEVVKPLVDTLHQVDAKLGQVEMDRATTTAKLDEQIRTLGAGPDRAERPDRRSRESAAPAARARPLGRAAAEAGRRARRDARSLRLLRAADRDVRRRTLQARPDREAARRQADRGRCEGAARRVPRVDRGATTRRARRGSSITRARCAST